jgi:hypothetical protein
MAAYDVRRVFEDIPALMGLDLVRRGDHWEGGYYLTGDTHPFRRDKMKVTKWGNDIWVHEEGGESVPIRRWLVEYGGCGDAVDALRRLRGHQVAVRYERPAPRAEEVRHVSPDAVSGAAAYDLGGCALFRWMCGLFPEDRVREVWGEYCVTTDGHGNCVYWYRDAEGSFLYDKRICYGADGHRDRSFFPGRVYRVGDGYTGRCYFGDHLPADGRGTYIVESEKSALLCRLYYGRRFVATGGKGNLRAVPEGAVLLPDVDAVEEWGAKGRVWPWWERWGVSGVPPHADIGDMVVWKILHNRK